jgi:hypothetical protein
MLSTAFARCLLQKLSQELPVSGTRQDGNAQHCVRSSLAQELARLTAAKLLRMFGGGPGQLLGFPAWEPPAVQPWTVQDPAINHWLDSMSDSTKTNLERCPPELRAKVTASVYTRSLSNTLVNPEAYLNGALHAKCGRAKASLLWRPPMDTRRAHTVAALRDRSPRADTCRRLP